MTTFRLPDLGEGLQQAEIVVWHVAAGDHVVADQPLVSVETDKAVFEIPAPQPGGIAKLYGEPGDRLQVGDPLVEFDTHEPVDSGTVVGEITTGEITTGEITTGEPVPAEQAPSSPTTPAPGRIKATPAVRARARELGVDLALVQASGPAGSITAADLQRAAAALAAAGPAQPLRGVRRAMAERMVRAHAEVVPATLTDEADVERWIGHGGSDIMPRLIRAVAAGCRAAPALNAWFDGRALTRRLHTTIDLGVAVNTEDGLFVPVLRDAGRRDPDDLKQALQQLKAEVATRTLPPEALRGQTVTLSNFGTLGGRFASLVVVPPQVAILGAGRIAPRVVAADGRPAVRRLLPLSLTFDHRAVNGGEAARFLSAAVADLELNE